MKCFSAARCQHCQNALARPTADLSTGQPTFRRINRRTSDGAPSRRATNPSLARVPSGCTSRLGQADCSDFDLAMGCSGRRRWCSPHRPLLLALARTSAVRSPVPLRLRRSSSTLPLSIAVDLSTAVRAGPLAISLNTLKMISQAQGTHGIFTDLRGVTAFRAGVF